MFHTADNFSSVLLPLGCVGSKLFVVFFQGYWNLLNSTTVSSRGSFMIGETGFIPGEEFIKRDVCLLIVEKWGSLTGRAVLVSCVSFPSVTGRFP